MAPSTGRGASGRRRAGRRPRGQEPRQTLSPVVEQRLLKHRHRPGRKRTTESPSEGKCQALGTNVYDPSDASKCIVGTRTAHIFLQVLVGMQRVTPSSREPLLRVRRAKGPTTDHLPGTPLFSILASNFRVCTLQSHLNKTQKKTRSKYVKVSQPFHQRAGKGGVWLPHEFLATAVVDKVLSGPLRSPTNGP